MPRVLKGFLGGEHFLIGEVPLYWPEAGSSCTWSDQVGPHTLSGWGTTGWGTALILGSRV
jgi:hypothetical protein